MSSYQMIRSFFTLLANAETLTSGIALTPSADVKANKEEALCEYLACVFVCTYLCMYVLYVLYVCMYVCRYVCMNILCVSMAKL